MSRSRLLPLPFVLTLSACVPELPDEKPQEGATAGDCTDGADNDEDGTFDCADDGCAAAPACGVEPGPPEGLAVTIAPAAPVDEDDLRCVIATEAVDPDGDTVSYAYSWTVDGADAGLATDTVSAAFTSVGQAWVCTVTPSDGTLTGTPATASVTVLQANRAPSAPSVAITPGEPNDDEGLACTVVTESVDPDGDAVTYAYAWTVDGADAGVTVASVDAARTSEGETWTCSVTASDGSASSEAGTASVSISEGGCGALSFDGVDDYAVTDPSGVTYGSALTVEMWFSRIAERVVGDYDFILVHGWSRAATSISWAERDDELKWLTNARSSWEILGTTPTPATDTWHHAAAVVEGATTRYFLDGELISTSSNGFSPGSVAATMPFHLGGMAPSACDTCQTDYAFGGMLGPIRVSNSARYSANFAPTWGWAPDTDALALWNLDDRHGTVATDSSTNVLHASIYGAEWTVVECPSTR